MCSCHSILRFIPLLTILSGLSPKQWYKFSALHKEYLYHDECFIANKSFAEYICRNVHNGDNVASLPNIAVFNFFINTLVTSEPVDGSSTCKTYNIPHTDRFITLGGTFLLDYSAKKDPGGLKWWNGDPYNASVLNWDSSRGEPNSDASSEPGIFLAYTKHTIHDGPFLGDQAFATICERAILTVDPTIDPTINPAIEPTLDPTYNPTINPTADPSQHPTTHPSEHPITLSVTPTASPTYEYTETLSVQLEISDTDIDLSKDIVNITRNSLEEIYPNSNVQTNIVSDDDNTIIIAVIVNSDLDLDAISNDEIESLIVSKLKENEYYGVEGMLRQCMMEMTN